MTTTLFEIFGIIAALAVIAAAVAFVRLALRINRTAREVEHATRRVAALTPNVQALLDNGNAELVELRALTRASNKFVGGMQTGTHETASQPAGIGSRCASIVAGARAGLRILGRARNVATLPSAQVGVMVDP